MARALRGCFVGRRSAGGYASILLLVAILPSFIYLGHWGLDLPLPRDQYIRLVPEPAAHHHAHPEQDKHEHARHCHTDAASCSDVPFTGASAFALLGEVVALLGAAALLIAVVRPGGAIRDLSIVSPELQPPRRAFS